MNKLTYLALIGSASAQLGKKDEMDFMKKTKPVCDYKDDETLTTLDFYVQLKYSMWNGAVKGIYNETKANPVTKECYGEWMTPKIESVMLVADKFDSGDIWTITKDEAEGAAENLIDLVFENTSKCGFERSFNNVLDWCEANTEKCLDQDGLWERLYNNAAPVFGKLFDLWNLINADDTCDSDVKIIRDAGKFT